MLSVWLLLAYRNSVQMGILELVIVTTPYNLSEKHPAVRARILFYTGPDTMPVVIIEAALVIIHLVLGCILTNRASQGRNPNTGTSSDGQSRISRSYNCQFSCFRCS